MRAWQRGDVSADARGEIEARGAAKEREPPAVPGRAPREPRPPVAASGARRLAEEAAPGLGLGACFGPTGELGAGRDGVTLWAGAETEQRSQRRGHHSRGVPGEKAPRAAGTAPRTRPGRARRPSERSDLPPAQLANGEPRVSSMHRCCKTANSKSLSLLDKQGERRKKTLFFIIPCPSDFRVKNSCAECFT